MTFENRIIGYGVKNADQFTAHPNNPKLHPQAQRDVMGIALKKLGWLAPVIENQRTGYLIDGHERVMQALLNNDPVPFVQVDLNEDEEAEALVSFDAIGELAYYDASELTRLLAQVETSLPDLNELWKHLRGDDYHYTSESTASVKTDPDTIVMVVCPHCGKEFERV